MNQELLDRLQEADHATWERVCQYAVGEYESFDGDGFEVKYTVSYEELFDDAKEAWLQACLQAAIRARGWAYQVSISFQGTRYGKIVTLNTDGSKRFHQDQHADTEAEALCLAYLAAIKAVRP